MLRVQNICTIKDLKVFNALMSAPYHPKIVGLLTWFACRYSDFCITSGFRFGDSGVHGTIPCRAVDLRSSTFKEPWAVRDDVNKHWVYDPDRPEYKCCVYHDAGSGFHFHLQVHPKTFMTRSPR